MPLAVERVVLLDLDTLHFSEALLLWRESGRSR